MNLTKKAFTLAEVLITITVIGVVAATTIPTLVQNYKDRQHKIQATNFQRKFGEALKIMDVQSNLQGFASTEEFVKELEKHMKITNVCATKPSDCFENPVKLADGTVFETSNIETSADLGRSSYDTNVLGLQFADGVTALIAYNPKYTNNDPTETVKYTYTQDGKLNLVKISTGVVSIVFDTTGSERPNQVGVDIIGVNAMLGEQRTSDEILQIGPYQVLDIGTGYSAIPCIENTGINSEYCTPYYDNTQDYWAGAKKACADQGMQLASQIQMREIYAYLTMEEYSDAKQILTGKYIGSVPHTGCGASYATDFDFDNGKGYCSFRTSQLKVMCIQ